MYIHSKRKRRPPRVADLANTDRSRRAMTTMHDKEFERTLRHYRCQNDGKPTRAEAAFQKLFDTSFKDTNMAYERQAIIKPYIADFSIPLLNLIVEIDGEYHDAKDQTEKDEKRTEYLKSKGYSVLRIRNEDVLNPGKCKAIVEILLSIARKQGVKVERIRHKNRYWETIN